MGIRGRLLILTMGVVIPLVLSGLVGLDWVWTASRDQLDASVRKQAELAAAAFDGWIEAERQPLVALAASQSGRPESQSLTEEELHSIVRAHPNWLAIEALAADGRTAVSYPASVVPLPADLAASLREELDLGVPSAIEVNWALGNGQPVLIIAASLDDGGEIRARVNASFASDAIRGIDLPSGSVITLFDPKHRIIQRYPGGEAFVGEDRSDSPAFARLRDVRSIVFEGTSRSDGVTRIYGMARVGSTGCVVGVGVPSAGLYEPARAQFNRYLLFGLAALAFAVVASLVIARTIASPMRYLSEAADGLGAGDFTVRAPDLAGNGEMADLARVFNTMARSLEERDTKLTELDRLKSEFVSSVSHELRTPLTTIKTLTQVLQRGGETAEERARYLEAIASECERQIHFVLDLLDLSRIEAGAFTLAFECVDVAEVVDACVSVEQFAAEAGGHELVADVHPDLPYVQAERAALRRVLRCLVENAVSYTPRGGRITLSAREDGPSVVVTVADTGRGIAAADLPHVFERFYRSADGADVEPCGVGLGLYLARTIVEHLGGEISVESEVGRGSAFSIRLKRWSPDEVAPHVIEESVNA